VDFIRHSLVFGLSGSSITLGDGDKISIVFFYLRISCSFWVNLAQNFEVFDMVQLRGGSFQAFSKEYTARPSRINLVLNFRSKVATEAPLESWQSAAIIASP
jgi:hypothetical protein